MRLDPKVIDEFTVDFQPAVYIRCTPLSHRKTPLGMGFGDTRFSSPTRAFKLLYIGQDLPTSVAEAIIRDRFEGNVVRELMSSEVADWGACQVDAHKPLSLLDLTGDACFRLGVSTDTVGAKAQDEARELSETVHASTALDGILYHSRLRKDCYCIAAYERAVSKLTGGAVHDLVTLASFVPAFEALGVTLIA